jgi:hypothetical protein
LTWVMLRHTIPANGQWMWPVEPQQNCTFFIFPDIFPCDFWIFGFVKGQLKGKQSTSGQGPLDAISAVTSEIAETELLAVYQEWIGRLKEEIRIHGECLTKWH